MPVWITESGYDTNPGSPFRAISIGNKSVLQVQADWILRTSLLYIRNGVDRVFFYEMYDEKPEDPTQFSSMGLINSDKTRKPAADYLYQANQLIGDFTYQQTISRDPVVDRYEKTLPDGRHRLAYVLLIPDEAGRMETYPLKVPKGQTVDVFLPQIGRERMTKQTLTSLNGTVLIAVSETPTFVLSQ